MRVKSLETRPRNCHCFVMIVQSGGDACVLSRREGLCHRGVSGRVRLPVSPCCHQLRGVFPPVCLARRKTSGLLWPGVLGRPALDWAGSPMTATGGPQAQSHRCWSSSSRYRVLLVLIRYSCKNHSVSSCGLLEWLRCSFQASESRKPCNGAASCIVRKAPSR